ncbi:hypothetical protein PGQ11_015314 [Apiospora arundinis]|uniref:Uncharacterized protein n=1 Tax=Apiospora arundinis TaxID=335852 RepID=A0ABR2HM59_9PEZI
MAGITSTLATVASMAPSPAPTPSAVYTPDPGCLDTSNNANYWMVTTSCFLTGVPYDTPGANNLAPPDWLRCTVPMFGVPGYGNPAASTCLAGSGPGYVTATVAGSGGNKEDDKPKTYFDGCPSGYGEAIVSSRPGYDQYKYPSGSYDISYYMTTCCPTVYPFQAAPQGLGQESRTSHDGVGYSLYVYPMPGCYATSIKALSGKTLPMQTTSNTQAWEKKKRQEQPPAATPTITWDYEKGTLYALPQIAAHTVFMGTHTCYEACSSWMEYYYPEETGAPGEPNLRTGEVTLPRPSETGSGGGGGKGGSAPTATAESGGSGSGGGSTSDKPKDSADAESANAQSPDISLASRLPGEFSLGSCSIVALMIPLMVAILVL